MCKNLYIALLHYPVYNKKGDVVTTAVTNMDIHDISRTARTYGVKGFYIITPIEQQQAFVERILHHWQKGYGITYNPSRKQAFDIVRLEGTLDDAITAISQETEGKVNVVVTSASPRKKQLTCEDLKEKMSGSREGFLIVFGTGWGIAEEVIGKADFFVEPIRGNSDYNHLSVRSATAVTLDRLCGRAESS
ncbi:MAG: RNA methyltransferase [Thermodesulfobacteriota bacterium]|nr:RNA methyltransferase [Thermodesulfobacteriota bacterium]